MDFNADQLWSLWGVALSLGFAYLPGVKDWFEQLDSRYKPLIMAGGLLLLTAGKLVVVCRLDQPCYLVNWWGYLQIWGMAILANIGTYQVVVRQFKQRQLVDAAVARLYSWPK